MVDDNDVKRYFLKNKVLTKANMRTYKISRTHQLISSVHSLVFNSMTPQSTFCVSLPEEMHNIKRLN